MRALVLMAGLMLGGCAVAIDEATVFAPPERESPAASEAELSARWLSATSDRPLDAAVSHGFVGAGETRIAYSIFRRPANEARPLIVHCGGNAADRYNSGVGYAGKGLRFGDVLLFDYPGYGDSPGAPTAAALEAASRNVAALAASTAQGRPIVLWGHSLGGFICGVLAQDLPEASGLIFETSARNAGDVAASWTPWYADPLISVRIAEGLARYDNAAAARAFGKPVLVLGAARDDTLPVRLSRALAKAIEMQGGTVTYVEFPDANHRTVPQAPGFDAAVAAYLKTLERTER
ncbi:MAG: alpha/beta fold hydrolase [Hyphomonadaceae bacterium]|nr:alpha/beta fold hydrolase [Hyphomonadaceae bacterium]